MIVLPQGVCTDFLNYAKSSFKNLINKNQNSAGISKNFWKLILNDKTNINKT